MSATLTQVRRGLALAMGRTIREIANQEGCGTDAVRASISSLVMHAGRMADPAVEQELPAGLEWYDRGPERRGGVRRWYVGMIGTPTPQVARWALRVVGQGACCPHCGGAL